MSRTASAENEGAEAEDSSLVGGDGCCLGPATRAYLRAADAFGHAQQDPRRDSRWPWKRNAAESRFWKAGEDLASWRAGNRRVALLNEAIGRAEIGRSSMKEPWRRPSLREVLSELDVLGETFPAGPDLALRALFPEGAVRMRQADRDLAAEAVVRMGLQDFSRAISSTNFIDRPHRQGTHARDDESMALAAFIAGDACRLPRRVTVWRGETPFPGDDQVSSDVMLGSPLGTVIGRPSTALSATWDPAVAGRIEHCGAACATADKDARGWVLEIRTDHVLDVSNRDTILGRTDGLAAVELEALVVAPRLRIDRRREALVDGQHCEKRVVMIECAALDE